MGTADGDCFRTLPTAKLGEATAVFHLSEISAAIDSVCVGMVIHATGVNYSVLSEHLSLFNETFSVSAIAAWTLETTTGLARLSDEVERQASMIGYINAFYLLDFAASVIPFIPFLKKPPTDSPPLRSFSVPFRVSGLYE